MSNIVKVLVVEDDLEQAELMESSLQRFNSEFSVEITDSGEACIERLNDSKFEAIVLDFLLPEGNGLEILDKISRNGYDTPVVLVSGHGSEGIAVEALKNGAYDYLVKNSSFLSQLPKVVQKTIEHHRLENRLRESETKYQNIFENASDAILIINPNTNQILESNRRFAQMTSLSDEEISLRNVAEFFPIAQRHHFETVLQNTVNFKICNDDQLSILDSQDQEIPVDINTSLVKLEDADYILCTIKDIAEKKHLQNLILNSKRRLQSTFDSIGDIIFEVNENSEIVIANRKFSEMCSLEPEKVIGRKYYELFFQFGELSEECPIKETFKTQQPAFRESQHNDEVYETHTYPNFSVDGQVESVAVFSRNITDKKKLENSLIQSEKLATIGLLASGIAHELRNPLNVIETARYYIDEFLIGKNPDISVKLDIIRRNVHRSSKIINNLLEFSQHSKHNREEIDIKMLVESTIALIKKELDAKNIEFVSRFENDYPCYFSMDSLKQVLLNLIINAIQAMEKGGKLTIFVEQNKAGYVDIKISDTGTGISDQNLKKIFSPFFTTKKAGEGTGLGLYITHMIIERDGGKISVESETGAGTTFTVSLPQKNRATIDPPNEIENIVSL